jgi:dimethylpropiothetin dethiomethylase
VTQPTRLSEHPDWGYLLRDIYDLYRYRSAGGSARIRSHQRQVRERLLRCMNDDPEVRLGRPAVKPVCRHLNRALDNGLAGPAAPVVRGLRTILDALHWQYGYDKVPPGLAAKYAFAELAGPDGPVRCDDLILGLVLFAPRCTYPAHSHENLVESYICLSGAASENDAGVYVPGSMIYNLPGQLHRITIGTFEPCLLLYAWVGDPEALAARQMAFSRSRKEH